MAFCSNTSGTATPPPSTPPLSATSGSPALTTQPAALNGGTAGPAVGGGLPAQTLPSQTPGWRDALKSMIPEGAQTFLGSMGVKGFSGLGEKMQGMVSPVTSVGNKQTEATGMNNPQIMAMIPKMQDPGEQKTSKGGGKMSSL